MKFFLTSLRLNIKKLALRRVFWVALVLLPIMLFGVSAFLLGADSPAVSVTAGVYFDSDCPYSYDIFAAAVESVSDTPFVNFVKFYDKNALIDYVRFRRVECGYVISPQIYSLTYGELSDIVTLIVSPQSFLADGLNELFAAAVFRVMSESIARNWLFDNFSDDDIDDFVALQFERYEQMDIFMTPLHITQRGPADAAMPSLAELTASRIMHGLIGLFALTLIIFYIPALVDERRSGLRSSLHSCGKLLTYEISLFFAIFIVMLAVSLVGLSVMFFFASSLLSDVLTEITALLVYLAVISALMTFTAALLKSAAIIQSFGLFIVLAHIFFGGILLNLYEISPLLGRIQYVFPLFWYVEAVSIG